MYSCGPTVYNYAHIGNLRAYVFTDTLRRILEWNGYNVKQVMNVTDIGQLVSDADEGEDKMTKALRREGKPLTMEAMKEVALFYEKAFVSDLKSLNIKLPSVMPRASEHIAEDIEIIKKLEEKEFIYKISDGFYFDTSKFSEYGKLGKIDKTGLKEGARVSVNPEKRSQADFNLWKFSAHGFPAFQSPFGLGFPGWHIECSAMSRKYLGQPFDIHTGGVDHIGTHHNNEIAQSEAAFDAPLANYWMHNEHLNVGPASAKSSDMASPASAPYSAEAMQGKEGFGEAKKMAKSGENFVTLKTLIEKDFDPLAYRYYLLGVSYRKPVVFSWEALQSAENTLSRLVALIAKMPEGGKIDLVNIQKFSKYINDDLNTSQALSLLWELIRDEKAKPADRRATVLKFDEVLGLNLAELAKKESAPIEIPVAVSNLLKEREIARNAKNWQRADELRGEIKKMGFEVKDTDAGQKVEKL